MSGDQFTSRFELTAAPLDVVDEVVSATDEVLVGEDLNLRFGLLTDE